MEVILHPDEIKDVISQTSTIVRFGVDYVVSDWRSTTRSIMAQTTSWKVKFKECKRFILVRSKKAGNVLVRGELFYKSDIGTAFNVCQRQKTISMIDAKFLPKIVAVNKNKLRDVKKLLTNHFGVNWENLPVLKIYKDLFASQEALQCTLNPEAEDYSQEPLDEVDDLRV
ncbi:unnamed protein product [Parnassius apollo]|uniref:(apollo) hypothetical protein n=1 Tax=Parnassius apollo TaxID=110799 RepID=A0A8S3WE09_PARAO|nr:unnamed protein product [Parnassius apollo]